MPGKVTVLSLLCLLAVGSPGSSQTRPLTPRPGPEVVVVRLRDWQTTLRFTRTRVAARPTAVMPRWHVVPERRRFALGDS